ncbi:hypothetical protein [Streptomyces malaysiensis]
MSDRLYSDSVTVVRAPLITDKYGQTKRDWPNATRTMVVGVSVQPDASTEDMGERSTVITGWRVRTPRGTDLDLLATDRAELDALTLEVDGEVARYTLGGQVHHVEARLKRVTG